MDMRLERRWGVSQTKRYYKVLNIAILYLKSYLLFISLFNLELIIGVIEVKFSKDPSLRKVV
jgi:hypothetical protein